MSLAGFLLGLGGLSMQANRGLSLNVPSPSPAPTPQPALLFQVVF